MSFDFTSRGGTERNTRLVFGARDRRLPVTDEAFLPGTAKALVLWRSGKGLRLVGKEEHR